MEELVQQLIVPAVLEHEAPPLSRGMQLVGQSDLARYYNLNSFLLFL